VRLSKLRDGRYLLHHVVTKELMLRYKGARVPGVDGDRFGRIDEVSCDLRRAIRWRLRTRQISFGQGFMAYIPPLLEWDFIPPSHSYRLSLYNGCLP